MQALLLVLGGGRSIDIEVVTPGQVLYSQLWVCIVEDAILIRVPLRRHAGSADAIGLVTALTRIRLLICASHV